MSGPPPLEVAGSIAVVTGGANGIGRGIVRALLEADATVVVADVEQDVMDATVAALSEFHSGRVSGIRTDVSDDSSVEALADQVFAVHGRCNLLFNNAGVGSGGGGRVWMHEPNDWRWCYGVNVFGVAHGIMAFVPRMLESGEPGHIVNTSSLMDTGLFTSQRNRPLELARVRGGTGRASMTFAEMKDRLEKAGRTVKVADLDELGRFVVECVARRQYVIGRELDRTVELLHTRADAIGRFEMPPPHDMGL